MNNNFETYKREIDRIIRQNPLECELYSIIASVLRSCNSSSDISIRDVTNLTNQSTVTNPEIRHYKMPDGTLATADFLFMDPKYKYSEKTQNRILGCCEIKALHIDLNGAIRNNPNQFKGELGTFHRLLYTNGIQWLYYEKTKKPLWKIELGKYHLKDGPKVSDEDYVEWNNDCPWEVLIENLNEMFEMFKNLKSE
ncbi:MAG: hypothetical protein NC319_06780 [Butyricicoccus sp.]|nr:hypothetical protein [Butyricicoccus sp.]